MSHPPSPDDTGATGFTRGTRTYTRTHTQVASGRRGRAVRLSLRARGALGAAWRRFTRIATAIAALITSTGWLVVAWGVIGTITGFVLGWQELIVGGLIAAILLLVAPLFLIGSEPHRVEFTLAQDAVVAGAHAEGSVTVTNVTARSSWPTRIQLPVGPRIVELQIPLLASGQRHTMTVALPTARRGVIDVGPAATAREDPLRLLRREFHWTDVYTLYVHPVTMSVPSTAKGFIRDLEGAATRVLTSEDISLHAVREYAAGDPRRHVHWKSTAKTGTLMVRQFEQTRRSTLAIVLDRHRDSYADEDEFETAISAAASLGVRAIRDGREVTGYTSGHVPHFARATVRSIDRLRARTPRALLDDLSALDASEQVLALEPLTRMVAESMHDISIAIVVTGSQATVEGIASAAYAFASDVSVATIVADPTHTPETAALGRVHVTTIGMLGDLPGLMARGAARQ